MRHALAFLATALLVAGCHKNTGENADQPSVDNPSYRDAGQTGSTQAPLDVPPPTTDGKVHDGGAQALGGGDRATVEACLDRWLQEHKLDQFGHPEGTMYAGGTPLFNEATGETRDRLEYVFARQPEARKACVPQSAQ